MLQQKTFQRDKAYARALDDKCPIKAFQKEFIVPKALAKRAYFCGHSLGAQPVKAQEEVQRILTAWQQRGVNGYFEGELPWLTYYETLLPHLADLVGARPSEVVVMNTLTTNLHLMMASFYRPSTKKFKILMEDNAFPSDRYAVVSQLELHGHSEQDGLILAKPRKGQAYLLEEDLLELIEVHRHDLAMILLPVVQYYSGQVFEPRALIKKAHQHDIIVGLDAAHAVGNVPMHLHAWGADFAVWCHYKYLNAGPGAVAGCFVHQGHGRPDTPRLAGWWGHDQENRMSMGQTFEPMSGAKGWQLSCPAMLSMAPLKASLELFHRAGFNHLRYKSLQLTEYLAFLLEPLPLEIITPLSNDHHGAQLTLKVGARGQDIFKALLNEGFYVDWREPAAIRVAPVPFYNSYAQVYDFADCLGQLL